MGLCESIDEIKRQEEIKRRNSRTMKLKSFHQIQRSREFCEDDIKRTFLKEFDKYDKNSDNTLDLTELTLFFRDIVKRKTENGEYDNYDPKQMAIRFIRMVDLDGDGKISREEIYKFYKQ